MARFAAQGDAQIVQRTKKFIKKHRKFTFVCCWPIMFQGGVLRADLRFQHNRRCGTGRNGLMSFGTHTAQWFFRGGMMHFRRAVEGSWGPCSINDSIEEDAKEGDDIVLALSMANSTSCGRLYQNTNSNFTMAQPLTLAAILSAARDNTLQELFAPPPPQSQPQPPPPLQQPERELQIFSDGSVRPWGPYAGCAIALFSRDEGKWHCWAFALGSIQNPNTTELHGINAALVACLARESDFDHFTIRSDCLNALAAVRSLRQSATPSSDPLKRTILERIRGLEEMGKQVSLTYVQGHSDHYTSAGNGMADHWAGVASQACEQFGASWSDSFFVWEEHYKEHADNDTSLGWPHLSLCSSALTRLDMSSTISGLWSLSWLDSLPPPTPIKTYEHVQYHQQSDKKWQSTPIVALLFDRGRSRLRLPWSMLPRYFPTPFEVNVPNLDQQRQYLFVDLNNAAVPGRLHFWCLVVPQPDTAKLDYQRLNRNTLDSSELLSLSARYGAFPTTYHDRVSLRPSSTSSQCPSASPAKHLDTQEDESIGSPFVPRFCGFALARLRSSLSFQGVVGHQAELSDSTRKHERFRMNDINSVCYSSLFASHMSKTIQQSTPTVERAGEKMHQGGISPDWLLC
ncbi:uncharacterized protein MYCFIDRAFT_177582 [Pseudocercospora fijiensis CIRAD86]|uniref:RNase H type-1 domain-containing protein n=1 Tax=Pseudocercospora fijiensis (strain CIRAD86) TaxID=383855 RepID=M3AT41_PSEFD|nr:uncharacterized protein MYCFIDRAFT_177582 [Pseudocercospora fijiensis CIRAD86]EME80652.1 hypothetical protein MYCFIDRAFT_177582 [Pseudocercospora fijiensis CIRAD86]